MDCPEDEIFRQLITDSLHEAELESVAEHLETCLDCTTRLDEIAGGRLLQAQQPDSKNHPRILDTSELADEVVRRVVADESIHSSPQSPGSVVSSESSLWQFLSKQLEPPRADDAVNSLDQYDILETIGEGGMGIVVRARDTKLNRIVALKIISPMLAANQEARQRFFREAKAAAAIQHEHVVTVHGVDEWQGIAYLVMRHIPGRTLQQIVDADGPLSADQVLEFGEQMALGLAAAHETGVVHRDIKPSNVLIEKPGDRVVITDFGLARSHDDTVLTRTGAVAGTPQFMSPEQAAGEPMDHRSDLYSLGSVLYFLTSGKFPWSGATAVSILRQICDGQPIPIVEHGKDVPAPLRAIIGKLLAREPNDRFATAHDVVGTIRAARSGDQLTELQPRPVRTFFARNKFPLAMTVSLLAVAAILAWPYVTQERPSEQTFDHIADDVPLSPATNSVPTPPLVEPDPCFQIVGRQHRYATLSEAVHDAESGAVIEISADEPFEAESVRIIGKALTLQGAPSSQVVLTVSDPSAGERGNWLSTDSDLVIRNLRVIDTARTSTPTPVGNAQRDRRAICCVTGATLTIENCQLQTSGKRTCVTAVGANCRMVNSSLIGLDYLTINWVTLDGGLELSFDNCVLQSSQILQIHVLVATQTSRLTIRNSTLVTSAFVRLMLPADIGLADQDSVEISLANTVMDAYFVCRLLGFRKSDPGFYRRFQTDTQGSLRQILNWKDEGTVYSRDITHFLDVRHTAKNVLLSSQSSPGPATVPEWMAVTGQSVDAAVSALVSYNEDLAADDIERYRLKLSDLRGLSDDATALPDGRQPGANIDLVGPQISPE